MRGRTGAWIYRNFDIGQQQTPVPDPRWREVDWWAVHQDYDGPEDHRCFYESSLAACERAVDDYWESKE